MTAMNVGTSIKLMKNKKSLQLDTSKEQIFQYHIFLVVTHSKKEEFHSIGTSLSSETLLIHSEGLVFWLFMSNRLELEN